MAWIEKRKRRDGGTSARVVWRLGGARDGDYQAESFSAGSDAQNLAGADGFKQMVEAAAVPAATVRTSPWTPARFTEQIPLPREAFDVLLQVYEGLKRGLAIHVAPLNAQLTTQEAANYLGISRPTLVKLLEAGEIPFIKPARHRYVRIDDLINYAERLRTQRAEALDEMARDAEEDGLYELLDGRPPKMR